MKERLPPNLRQTCEDWSGSFPRLTSVTMAPSTIELLHTASDRGDDRTARTLLSFQRVCGSMNAGLHWTNCTAVTKPVSKLEQPRKCIAAQAFGRFGGWSDFCPSCSRRLARAVLASRQSFK